MAKFTCERFGEFRHFDSFEECERFVRREGSNSRGWSYTGAARDELVARLIHAQAAIDFLVRGADADSETRVAAAVAAIADTLAKGDAK